MKNSANIQITVKTQALSEMNRVDGRRWNEGINRLSKEESPLKTGNLRDSLST
jgi:hypothetical protein